MEDKTLPDEDTRPPSERYISIMIEGAEHFGVKEEHINKLRN